MEDGINRIVYGSLLNLAKNNPNILYLFKLPICSICSIAYGNKSEITNIKTYDLPLKTTYFLKDLNRN